MVSRFRALSNGVEAKCRNCNSNLPGSTGRCRRSQEELEIPLALSNDSQRCAFIPFLDALPFKIVYPKTFFQVWEPGTSEPVIYLLPSLPTCQGANWPMYVCCCSNAGHKRICVHVPVISFFCAQSYTSFALSAIRQAGLWCVCLCPGFPASAGAGRSRIYAQLRSPRERSAHNAQRPPTNLDVT